jgi:hypothetical protein
VTQAGRQARRRPIKVTGSLGASGARALATLPSGPPTMSEISAQGVKGCRGCREVKPVSEFYVWRGKLRYRCKRCEAAYARQRRHVGVTQALERARYHAPNGRNRAKVAAQTVKWKARNKAKRRVHYAVEKAIKRGVLVRQPCEVCGAKAHAHHVDYGKPLEVQWLCPLHHARQHVAEGRMRIVLSAD